MTNLDHYNWLRKTLVWI